MHQPSSNQAIDALINDIGKQKIFEFFSNQQIMDYLNKRGLPEFLSAVPATILREAAENREEYDDEMAVNKDVMKYNVLDFTMRDLVVHCWNHRLIDFHYYQNHEYIFSINDHSYLGNLLVRHHPQQYYIGNKSHHYNFSKQIEKQYGKRGEDSESAVDIEQPQHQQGSNQQRQSSRGSNFIVSDGQCDQQIREQDKWINGENYSDSCSENMKRKVKKLRGKKRRQDSERVNEEDCQNQLSREGKKQELNNIEIQQQQARYIRKKCTIDSDIE